MSIPLVSVVIPTFNRARHILDAVKTAHEQTYENVETVVVIDGSTDDTATILEGYKEALPLGRQDRLTIVRQENKGVSAARNEGIRRSNGRYVAVLDDDDRWVREKLAKQVDRLNDRSAGHLSICTTDYYAVDLPSSTRELVECGECMSMEGQIRLGMFPPPSTWLFSRECFEALGGFDEELHAGEDADFITGLRRQGATFVNMNEPLTLYTLPPKEKVYRDEQGSAVRTLQKHYVWRSQVLSREQHEIVLDWYRKKLPPDLYQSTMARVRADETARRSK
jgi:glycosyltransferase involved in cell wall biosynthesis